MSAFEIVEHDTIDGSDTKPAKIETKNEPKREAAKQESDICKIFLPNVQYRVKKATSGVGKTSGKPYMRILIEEAGYTLDVYDHENHQVKEGDFIIIKSMKPIESREYNGKTTYSTLATIELANSLSQQSFVDDNTPLPFD
jgi:hypothetical protein